MDLQTLSDLFASTYSSNPNVRKSSELEIRKIGVHEGFIAALLQIIGSSNVPLETRQACCVYVKNRVFSSYNVDVPRTRPDQAPISPSDCDALRHAILPLLASSPSRGVSLQLAHALKSMTSRDFPEKWPGLLEEVKHLLASSNSNEVGAGCVASLEIVRAFRFRQNEDTLATVVTSLFPSLVEIATRMAQVPPAEASPEIPVMLHYILKAYKTSTTVGLSEHQRSAESLVPWAKLLFQMVSLDIPKGVVPENEEERERSEWWKAKKWAFATLGRLFHRYGNPSQLPTALKKQYQAFAEHFITNFAPEIFKLYLHQVDAFISGHTWLSAKCQYFIFQFLTECVKPRSMWQLLKPHFENLVSALIFPHLCFTPAKQELWHTDPVDYVRTTVDEYENFTAPVSAATTFLISLASNRTKATFMPILAIINRVLQSNPANPQKYGALNMTAALGALMMRHPEVKGNMEQFLMQHVAPEYSSPDGYMRAMACEVVGTVEKSEIVWSSPENLNTHFHAVANALDDPELPVRVQAALALTEMVDNHDIVRSAVSPQVGKVIQDLLKMSEETDLDLLNNSMDKMVEHFQDELAPVAAQLTARLCESYMRLVKDAPQAEEGAATKAVDLEAVAVAEDDDKTYAAMGVAKTIGVVVSSVDSSPEILSQVQDVIIPIIVFTLEHKILDLFDNVYDLIDVLTFKTHAIAPAMWPVFELTYKLFKSDAIDFLDEMLPALDNFVSFGTDVFKSTPQYINMMLDIYTTSMQAEQLGELDRVNGCKLAEAMMLNLRGDIDEAVRVFITTALAHQGVSETKALKLANLEVLVNAVLYNASGALHVMEGIKPGTVSSFLDEWFAAIATAEKSLPRVHDKKLSILALSALLELSPASGTIPPALEAGWPHIVSGLLKLFDDLPRAIESRKQMEEAVSEVDLEGEDLGDDILNMTENDDDVWDDESAYLEMLANEGARLRAKAEGKTAEGAAVADDDGETVSSESDIEEELGFFSPLDAVDPYSSFKQALSTFQHQNGPGYQAATTSLTVEQQTALMEVMRKADEADRA